MGAGRQRGHEPAHPVIATDAVGAAAGGLVRDGRNGLVVPAGDAAALAARDRAPARRPGACASASAPRARRPCAAYTFEAWAAGFAAALASAASAGCAASVTSARRPATRRCALASCDALLIATRPRCSWRCPRPRRAPTRPRDLPIDDCRDEHVDGTYIQRTTARARPPAGRHRRVHRLPRGDQRARLAALGTARRAATAAGAPAPAAPAAGRAAGQLGRQRGAPARPAPATSAPSSNAARPGARPATSEQPQTTATDAGAPPRSRCSPVGPVGNVDRARDRASRSPLLVAASRRSRSSRCSRPPRSAGTVSARRAACR